MSLNLDLVRDRFSDITQSLDRLDQIARMSRASFLADQDTLDITSYRLLIAIESAVQLSSHVSAHRAHRIPETNVDCFAILSEAGILSPDLSHRLQQMARLEDMLVHIYWDVDYTRVYDVLQQNLADLRSFVRAIGSVF